MIFNEKYFLCLYREIEREIQNLLQERNVMRENLGQLDGQIRQDEVLFL